MNKRWVYLVLTSFVATLSIAGCNDLPTRVGDLCQTDEHCGGNEGTFELVCDNTLPGGSCTVLDCTPETDQTDPANNGCPEGSRCVREGELGNIHNICRRSCEQQRDCREIIRCDEIPNPDCPEREPPCTLEEETITECANKMECVPFWDLPEEVIETLENPLRACILKDSKFEPEAD